MRGERLWGVSCVLSDFGVGGVERKKCQCRAMGACRYR